MKLEKNYFEKQKSKKLMIVFLAFIGILMIAASYIFKGSSTYESSYFSYEEKLEKRIEGMIEKAIGEGKATVMITTESTNENVTYENTSTNAFFSQSSNDNTKNDDSITIKGVMIICNGITHTSDFETIKEAVSTVLAINKNQIYIIGGAL